MKKSFKINIIIAVFCCLCISCSKKTASEEQMYKYVLKNYGEATFIHSEKTNQALTYYYKDNEYQFDYWVESKISDFHVDGSSFFKFEKKVSNFEEQYYYALYQQLQKSFHAMEIDYHISISDTKIKTGWSSVHTNGFVEIIFQDTDEECISAICQGVANLIREADTRTYWDQAFIKAYDCNGTYLGRQNISENRFITFTEEELSRFQLLAKGKNQTAKYQYMQSLSLEEFSEKVKIPIDKLQPQNESTVTLYHFLTDDGVAFFVANVIVNGECLSDYSGY